LKRLDLINQNKIFRDAVRFLERKSAQVYGELTSTKVNVFWFEHTPNFGDLLNPALFRHYGLTPVKKPRAAAEVFAIGSILDDLPENFTGTILGSGLMHDAAKRLPCANILALRGELTRGRLDASKQVPLGDPGLLAPWIYQITAKKEHALGLIPHYNDKADPRLQIIQRRDRREVLIIDVQQGPRKVIAQIAGCETILSSSLHGLVIADALGIPNAWLLLSDKVAGQGFKFRDHASALGRTIEPRTIAGDETLAKLRGFAHAPDAQKVAALQHALDAVFRSFASQVLAGRAAEK
jgi:pyruvyltransferase